MLSVESIDAFYGKSHVLFDVSLRAGTDEVVAVLGRNGAGKTTLLRSVMGLTPPRSGRVVFDGRDVTGDSPASIANRGVGYVPQDRRLFPDLTVRENLMMGVGTGEWDPSRVAELLERFPQLEGRLDQRAGSLSGGEQQMVAMARALVREPKLVLLDEPTEGLMPALVPAVGDAIREMADEGYTIVLVEQHVDLALDLADRVYLLENGRVRAESTPEELRADEALLERYLGV
jgi:branched-chain amino acid transport system ATP-binding protein